LKEALYYKKLDNERVQCLLCPHNCIINEGSVGICGIRRNKNGILYAESYGKVSAVAIDPIEKKPLYHFYPGSGVLSFGTLGCNFKCPYCQNWHISQNVNYPTEFLTPEEAIEIAIKNKTNLISYTYSEPLIWYEWVLETSKLAKKKDFKNILVTNGYINLDPLKEIVKYTDAANIDVKAFNQDFYTKLCKAKLEPVLKNVEYLFDKIHIELTMLIIPGWNDKLDEIEKFCKWVGSLSKDIPVHFSRYFPQYKFDEPPTEIETLKKAYEIGKSFLNYVYLGNVYVKDTDNTYCPNCNKLLIKRAGYFTEIVGLDGNLCKKCKTKIKIVI